MPSIAAIDRQRIADCSELIRPHIRRTPVIEIDGRDLGITHPALTLKLEHLQCSGSFKARGAFANLLMRQVPVAGVAAASGGNHGAAVPLTLQLHFCFHVRSLCGYLMRSSP